MKQLLHTQHHSHRNSKAWASLDCLLTSLPITPLSRSSIKMRSNGNLSMTDTRRISPQTTTSSGYHSDLSSATSANESPQSIHEIYPIRFEKSSSSSQIEKKTILVTSNSTYEKPLTTKNLSRLSSFIRKQYERAKSKLIPKPLSSSLYTPTTTTAITTCSKATSTTPLSHLSEENYTLTNKQNSIDNPKTHYLSSVYKQNSYTEPVFSVYAHPLHKSPMKTTTPYQHKNYTSIHECYSHQPSYRYSSVNNSQQYSSSYRRLATMANFENNKNFNLRRHHYYPVEIPSSCQTYNPYQYTNKNYDYHRSNYVSLSDVISAKNSAFKPIEQKVKAKQFYQRPSTYNIYEQIPLSDDPCDLEVAQYFPQTSQWSNPNYFDIYSKDMNVQKQTYTETLC